MTPYEACTLCPRMCGVNREGGERGRCHMSARLTLARAALHLWEEPPISGTRGSGTVFFSGCPLGCIYCQNRPIASGKIGKEVPRKRLEEIFWELCEAGAHNINLVTATQFAPTVVEAIRAVRSEGFSLPFVWNTSGYECRKTLELLRGQIDIFLTDLRYSTAAPAAAYSGAPDYPAVARDAIREMVAQTGECQFDAAGLMTRGTLVRLLLLPGHLADAKLSLLHLWRHYGSSISISLMRQYTPIGDLPPPLDRCVEEAEYASLVRYARGLGVTNAFVQDAEAAKESFIPLFDCTGI